MINKYTYIHTSFSIYRAKSQLNINISMIQNNPDCLIDRGRIRILYFLKGRILSTPSGAVNLAVLKKIIQYKDRKKNSRVVSILSRLLCIFSRFMFLLSGLANSELHGGTSGSPSNVIIKVSTGLYCSFDGLIQPYNGLIFSYAKPLKFAKNFFLLNAPST